MAFRVAVSTNVAVCDDESGIAKDVLFKLRVEATEQMTHNWTFCSPRISENAKIASKWHVGISYYMFPYYSTPKKLRELIHVESSSAPFYP